MYYDFKHISQTDILIIGSGPSSILTAYYLSLHYKELKICIISKDFINWHCTYGVFYQQIKDSWLLEIYNKTKLFTRIFPAYANFSYKNKMVHEAKLTNLNDDYCLLNNEYLFYDILKKLALNKQVDLIKGTVNNIEKHKNALNYSVSYFNNDIMYYTKCKIVLEGSGNYKSIGIKYDDNIKRFKQKFVGYEIKLKENHNINKAILLDWYNPYQQKSSNYKKFNKPTFCYILPISENTLFVEETILVSDKNRDTYQDLESKLEKRLYDYGFKKYNIIRKEKNEIYLNRTIPSYYNSTSFGIGVAGNMLNMMSGYSIGYNIYHIPEICNLLDKYDFILEDIYRGYWNIFRQVIYYINLGGLNLMNNIKDEKEFIEFHKIYFEKIALQDEYHHKLIFHNCDNDINLYNILKSALLYLDLPKDLLYKMIYNVLKSFLFKN